MDAIVITELTKKFGTFTAVDAITFRVKSGEIFGFLGPNGAGKTTTLAMLSTLLAPSSGKAEVCGSDIVHDKAKVRSSIGMVFQDMTLDDELTAEENLLMHGRLYGVPKKELHERIKVLLSLVDLADRKKSYVKTFSGGMKRRLEIARGLLHEPKVLFLDEPTLGLDPQTRNKLWLYIKKLNQEKGLTIILTTHYMDEADKLSDRIAIIDTGKIITLDTPEKLKQQLGGDVITIETKQSVKFAPLLQKQSWCSAVQQHGQAVTFTVADAGKLLGTVTKLAEKENISLETINIRKPSLEDVFLHFTGKTIREQEADGKDAMRMARRMWTKK